MSWFAFGVCFMLVLQPLAFTEILQSGTITTKWTGSLFRVTGLSNSSHFSRPIQRNSGTCHRPDADILSFRGQIAGVQSLVKNRGKFIHANTFLDLTQARIDKRD